MIYIKIEFNGTGMDYNTLRYKYNCNLVKVYGKESKYVLQGNGTYEIVGCGITGMGRYSVENIVKETKKFLLYQLGDDLKRQKCEAITITIRGHSRGGVSAVKFANELRDMRSKSKNQEYVNSLKDNNKCNKNSVNEDIIKLMNGKEVTINLQTSEAYYGPTASGENANTSVTGEPGDKNTVILSTHTMFSCTPMMIRNADVVVINEGGHNEAGSKLYSNFNPGVYYCYKRSGCNITESVDGKDSIKKLFNIIEAYNPRRHVIMILVCIKLDIKPEQLIDWISDYSKWFKNVLIDINKSLTLNGAFKVAFYIFDSPKGIFYSLIHKPEMQKGADSNQKNLGKFYKELKYSQNACIAAGIFNQKQSKLIEAIAFLYNVILRKENCGKASYKTALSSALILKIYSRLTAKNKLYVIDEIIKTCKKHFKQYAKQEYKV